MSVVATMLSSIKIERIENMFKVKVINKNAWAGDSVVEYAVFYRRENAEAFASLYWKDSKDFMAILEEYPS